MFLYSENKNCSVSELISFAEKYALSGDIIKYHIAWHIMNDENPYSLSLERRESLGSADDFARSDLTELYNAFVAEHDQFENYIPLNKTLSGEEKRISKMITDFSLSLSKASNFEEFFCSVRNFYHTYGVGSFGINKAFCLQDDGEIKPVSHLKEIDFNDISGYDSQKERLILNTAAFAKGGIANNVLLYGDSGTGKSSSIKAVLNMFYDKGIRMIQIQKHQFVHLGALTQELKNRNYRFILYLDDLSFEDFEVEYKYLKAAIEGGLEEKAENVLIYATSNRRHLIKETFTEREGGNDIHRNETIQEKISLSDRFGLSIFFPKPTQQEYFNIVEHLAEKEGLTVNADTLIDGARKWGIAHGGYSGRVATQFINHLKITENK